ncbi:MAG: ACP S-malonyltransferase [Acidobacteriota bacterium]|jgi:[acyl-carrier-protein] S-malonyltransferase
MEGILCLFPGQGSQHPGMGLELARAFPEARSVFEEADRALEFDLSRRCFEGPEEELRLTAITQPAILTVSVAAWRVLAARGLEPALVAGHSLGEYAANVAAGSLAFADAVRTVHLRGRWMQEAVPEGEGAMAALLGLDPDATGIVCEEAAAGEVVSPANFNAPGQIVIAGHAAAVERAMALALDRGASRAVPLPVSAPFHCALMRPAEEKLAAHLSGLRFGDPSCPIITNVDAAPTTGAEALRRALMRQVTAPVRWDESMAGLAGRGIRRALEVGPGKVLTGLLRRIDRSIRCLPVGDPAGVEKALET